MSHVTGVLRTGFGNVASEIGQGFKIVCTPRPPLPPTYTICTHVKHEPFIHIYPVKSAKVKLKNEKCTKENKTKK